MMMGGGSGAVVGVAGVVGVVEIVIAVVVVADDGDYGGDFPNRRPFGPNGFRHHWDKIGINETCIRSLLSERKISVTST